eukprot:TRINITY_DN11154_c0_g1_i2.p1 TRINITY_DN11154_c0_g1~~TRINITY_DN11154_c0_g1_i2.p1  ORF type:complete len:134 (+),score=20.10 TRINITY_DN11154_c0_g1_i2:263-664(+)
MDLRVARYLESCSHILANENYFLLHRNYAFSDIRLKHRRILAYLCKKLAPIEEYTSTLMRVLFFLLSYFHPSKDRVEADINEFLESHLLYRPDGKLLCRSYYLAMQKIFDSVYARVTQNTCLLYTSPSPRDQA